VIETTKCAESFITSSTCLEYSGAIFGPAHGFSALGKVGVILGNIRESINPFKVFPVIARWNHSCKMLQKLTYTIVSSVMLSFCSTVD
jgi:hypothetical protein